MSDVGKNITRAIDKAVEDASGDGFREHLGASIIGGACKRATWYKFRWHYSVRHTGRILRLFQRGQDEEARLVSYLRGMGAVVEDRDPETGKQFLIADFGGHFGGSGDGRISNLERFGIVGKGLVEFKTHGDRSFKDLAKSGLVSAKLEHYVQMQIYMHYQELPWGLYVAINKNDDGLHIELVVYSPEVVQKYQDLAKGIIEARVAPPRISNDPSWFVCKMCDFREICHYQKEPAKNCRSCVMSKARIEERDWYCDRWHDTIPLPYQRKGCTEWTGK